MELKKTQLYERHIQLGAKMTEFGGWLMPLDYGSIIEEHRQVRAKAGVFDVSHMGRLLFGGEKALEALQRLLTIDIRKVPVGTAHYALLCNESGGILDDLMVLRPDESAYLLIVNAANKDKDLAWATQNIGKASVSIDDLQEQYGILALQGPEAARILSSLTDLNLAAIPKDGCSYGVIAGARMLLSRTGYTGEDGFELLPDSGTIPNLWNTFLDKGVSPCGLGARDTLRLEAALPLYGHELTGETNPFEAGLGWVVDLTKEDFIGRDALVDIKRKGPERKLVCLEVLSRNIARAGSPIYQNSQEIGFVTSGSFSPSLNKSIAMGYVPVGISMPETQLEVGIRDRTVSAIIVKRPFYRGSALK